MVSIIVDNYDLWNSFKYIRLLDLNTQLKNCIFKRQISVFNKKMDYLISLYVSVIIVMHRN